MQLVSREVLFDVMSKRHPVKFKLPGSLDEDETDSSAFRSFMTGANRLYDKNNGDMYYFNDDMFNFMKDNEKNIRYVGEGSSRIVYALADGTALKVAKTDAGVA